MNLTRYDWDEYNQWFVKFMIPYICDADFHDYRNEYTLEFCLDSYNEIFAVR